MRRANTRAERFAEQALLVRTLKDFASDLPDLWDTEIDHVLNGVDVVGRSGHRLSHGPAHEWADDGNRPGRHSGDGDGA